MHRWAIPSFKLHAKVIKTMYHSKCLFGTDEMVCNFLNLWFCNSGVRCWISMLWFFHNVDRARSCNGATSMESLYSLRLYHFNFFFILYFNVQKQKKLLILIMIKKEVTKNSTHEPCQYESLYSANFIYLWYL